jgi:hypothetical protein
MKKSILFFCFAFISSKFFAQIEKGTIVPSLTMQVVAGNNQTVLGTSGNKYSFLSFSIAPGYGRFIRQNLLLKIEPTFNKSKSITEFLSGNGMDTRILNSDFGMGLRCSMTKYKFISENLAFGISSSVYGGFSEGGSKTIGNITNSDSYHNSVSATIQIFGNVNYFLTKNLVLSASFGVAGLNYQYSPYSTAKHIHNHNITFNFSPSFNNFGAGLSYFIRPKPQTN